MCSTGGASAVVPLSNAVLTGVGSHVQARSSATDKLTRAELEVSGLRRDVSSLQTQLAKAEQSRTSAAALDHHRRELAECRQSLSKTEKVRVTAACLLTRAH